MSDEIVSLFSLMDSHLSRARQDNISTEDLENNLTHSASRTLLPKPPDTTLVIPKFFTGNSPIKDLVAEQILNMLKAKEKRIQQEAERLQNEEIKKETFRLEKEIKVLSLNDQNHDIVLMPAIIPQSEINEAKQNPQLNSDTVKNNLKVNAELCVKKSNIFTHFDNGTNVFKQYNVALPCCTDISYVAINNHQKGTCSRLGKVLCSRKKNFRYLLVSSKEERFESSKILRFDFKTKPPSDLCKDSQRKKQMSILSSKRI